MRTALRKRLGAVLAMSAALATSAQAREARAGGGFFVPAMQSGSVTQHRMVLSVSARESTLWDQVTFSGSPSDFAWILPVPNATMARVRVGDERFINVIDAETRPLVSPPSLPSGCAFDAGAPDAGPSDAPMDGGSGGPTVAPVGPYEVATIRGMDAMALRNWLSMRGYNIPSGAVAALDHYAAMNSDFIAVRLRPGMGVNRMAPIRVTVPTMWTTLPLRMITAGVAERVSVSLWVLAPTRMRAMNLPNAEIREADLSYDFNSPTVPVDDYNRAFERLNMMMGGQVVLTEMSDDVFAGNRIEALAESTLTSMPRDGGVCPSGGMTDGAAPCSDPDPVDDARTAFAGFAGDGGAIARAAVTRLRANFTTAMLASDLALVPAMGPARPRSYAYGTVVPPSVCVPEAGPEAGPDAVDPDGGPLDGGEDARDGGVITFDVPLGEVSQPDVVIVPPDVVDASSSTRYIAAGGCAVGRTGSRDEHSPLGGLLAIGGLVGAAVYVRRRGGSRTRR